VLVPFSVAGVQEFVAVHESMSVPCGPCPWEYAVKDVGLRCSTTWPQQAQPKKVLYHDTGHDLNDPRALEDRYDWLVKYINLRREPLFKSSAQP
jgi:hypothetical protein